MRKEQKRDAARTLRRNSTDVERVMWRLLRDRRFAGIKFRRQVPIGPYIADFASARHQIVVEVDGGQHGGASDKRRDVFLTAHGWRVIRFWTTMFFRIEAACWNACCKSAKSPHPNPLPL